MSRSFEEVCIDLELAEQRITDIEQQLSASQQECERLTVENRQLLEGLSLNSDVRKQTARECIDIIYSVWAQTSTGKYANGIMANRVKENFGLEG